MMKNVCLFVLFGSFTFLYLSDTALAAANVTIITRPVISKSHCIQFDRLWKNAETGNPAPEYKYQCAIRLSITLHNVGVDMRSFSQKTVTPAPGRQILGRIMIDGLPAATRADEMAVWLKQHPFCGLGAAEDITGRNWKDKVYGKTGIIAFSSYWGKNQAGGHIDLWNKTRFPYPLPSLSIDGTLGILANFSRFAFGGWGIYNGGYYGGIGILPNLADAKRIIFFEIK